LSLKFARYRADFPDVTVALGEVQWRHRNLVAAMYHGLMQVVPEAQKLPRLNKCEPLSVLHIQFLTRRQRLGKQVSIINQDLLVLA